MVSDKAHILGTQWGPTLLGARRKSIQDVRSAKSASELLGGPGGYPRAWSQEGASSQDPQQGSKARPEP